MPLHCRLLTLRSHLLTFLFFAFALVSLDMSAENAPRKDQPEYLQRPTTLLDDRGAAPVHFVWGAEMGSGIDLTGNDMTYTEIGAYFGFKNSWVQTAGFGASIYSMLNNSSRCYPVYAIFRSAFSRRPRLCFMDLRLGLSFNNMLDYKMQTDFFSSLGLGFTLAHSRRFSSHIIVSYQFMPMSASRDASGTWTNWHTSLHYASVRFGCSF